MHFDVFNGDADGICALVQLRLSEPKESVLVTGIKRDIQLLDKVSAKSGDTITVLDISLAKNIARVRQLLEAGISIFYVDHHEPGDIPSHAMLKTIIDMDNAVCTSLLVNKHLDGRFPLWAITAAFGDNLDTSAEKLAGTIGVSDKDLLSVKNLGIYINYNGYGSEIADLHFPPDSLYRALVNYQSPLDFIADDKTTFEKLSNGYNQDMANAFNIKPEYQSDSVAVYVLPDVAWARRVSGVFGNDLANRDKAKAHAVLSINEDGGYLISVRAPMNNKVGASEFCSQFPTGGGRKSAAGINHLPLDQMSDFIHRFDRFYKEIGQ